MLFFITLKSSFCKQLLVIWKLKDLNVCFVSYGSDHLLLEVVAMFS